MMNRNLSLISITLILASLALVACSVESDQKGFRMYNPELSSAGATATVSAANMKRQNDELDLAIKATSSAQEAERHQVAIAATATAVAVAARIAETQAQIERQVTQERGKAEIDAIRIKAEAEAEAQRSTGEAQAAAVRVIGWGLSIALVLTALAGAIRLTGRNKGRTQTVISMARFLQIGVASPSALITPSPLSIDEGYLVDISSGDRAKLSDAAGIARLSSAAKARGMGAKIVRRMSKSAAQSNRDKCNVTRQTPHVPSVIEANVSTSHLEQGFVGDGVYKRLRH